MHKVAIVGLTSLETLAIRNILEGYVGIRSESHLSFASIKDRCDEFDRFVVSCEELVRHLDFFLPRKARVIAISRSSGDITSIFSTIPIDMDLTEIIPMFDTIMKDCENTEGNGELTTREIEVLRELVSGITVKEIADRLNISSSTVVTHRKNISAKLGIRSVSGLSLYAVMHGII